MPRATRTVLVECKASNWFGNTVQNTEVARTLVSLSNMDLLFCVQLRNVIEENDPDLTTVVGMVQNFLNEFAITVPDGTPVENFDFTLKAGGAESAVQDFGAYPKASSKSRILYRNYLLKFAIIAPDIYIKDRYFLDNYLGGPYKSGRITKPLRWLYEDLSDRSVTRGAESFIKIDDRDIIRTMTIGTSNVDDYSKVICINCGTNLCADCQVRFDEIRVKKIENGEKIGAFTPEIHLLEIFHERFLIFYFIPYASPAGMKRWERSGWKALGFLVSKGLQTFSCDIERHDRNSCDCDSPDPFVGILDDAMVQLAEESVGMI